MVRWCILERKTGIIWELSWETSTHSFSHLEDLHVAFLLGRICEWRARQLEDAGGAG
jgi:hypothetical protein